MAGGTVETSRAFRLCSSIFNSVRQTEKLGAKLQSAMRAQPPTHLPTEAKRSRGLGGQNYTAKADDNPHARARATAMTQPAGEKSSECRARAAARGDTVSTWHFTSEEPRDSSPDFPPVHTHTERRGERENRSSYNYQGEKKSL